MAGSVARVLLMAIALAALTTAAVSAQELSPETRMAQTISEVCLESMREPRELGPDDFGDQFVLEEVDDGVTRLSQARGQPWVRLRLNGDRPGACGANFSAAGGGSPRAGYQLAALIARDARLRPVVVRGARAAFTFRDTEEPFDDKRHPYVAYLFAGGYHIFAFVSASPEASGEGETQQPSP